MAHSQFAHQIPRSFSANLLSRQPFQACTGAWFKRIRAYILQWCKEKWIKHLIALQMLCLEKQNSQRVFCWLEGSSQIHSISLLFLCLNKAMFCLSLYVVCSCSLMILVSLKWACPISQNLPCMRDPKTALDAASGAKHRRFTSLNLSVFPSGANNALDLHCSTCPPGLFLHNWSLSPVLLPDIIPSQVQDFAFSLVELCGVIARTFIQLLDVPLNSSPALKHPDIAVFHRLLYGAYCLIVQIVNKDIFPSSEPQRAPLRAGLHGIDHNTLNARVQLIFHLHYSPPIEIVSPLCLKNTIGDHPEISSKDRVNDTHYFPVSYRAGLLITGSSQVAQAAFPHGKSLLIAPSHLQPITCSRKIIEEDLLHNLPRNWCENDWSVVPQSILTLPEDRSDVCVIRNLPRLPQSFKYVIMWTVASALPSAQKPIMTVGRAKDSCRMRKFIYLILRLDSTKVPQKERKTISKYILR